MLVSYISRYPSLTSMSDANQQDFLLAHIKGFASCGLGHCVDYTNLFADTLSKAVCAYIIENFEIDTEYVKNLVDDDGISVDLM